MLSHSFIRQQINFCNLKNSKKIMSLLHKSNSQEEKLLTELLNQDLERKKMLLAVRRVQQDFDAAHLYISAGFIRNMYWDYAHHFAQSTPLNDVDVVYFDKQNTSIKQDQILEEKLSNCLPNTNWSVKNQARMHHKSGNVPYTSLSNALSNWVETATTVGVCTHHDDSLSFLAPWGFQDLFSLVLRPTPYFATRTDVFFNRIYQKGWLQQWKRLTIHH